MAKYSAAGIEMGRSFHQEGTVVNLVLLKCRKLRREDQETSDWIVSRILYCEPKLLVAVVIEISILSNFTRLFYRHFWRRDFLGGGDKFKQSKHLREALVCYGNFPWVLISST